MNDTFNYTASTLSTEELKARIEDRPNYLPETIEASIAELKTRGIEFSDEEMEVINADLQAQRENALLPNRGQGLFNNDYKNNIIIDPAAPYLYSRRAVYLFTLFFGALFGSILMAMNIAKVKNTKSIIWMLLFGVVFTTIQIAGAQYANTGSSYGILCGLISAICIDYIFWNKFIGNSSFYRARKIWVPLTIALAIATLFILAVIYGPQEP